MRKAVDLRVAVTESSVAAFRQWLRDLIRACMTQGQGSNPAPHAFARLQPPFPVFDYQPGFAKDGGSTTGRQLQCD